MSPDPFLRGLDLEMKLYIKVDNDDTQVKLTMVVYLSHTSITWSKNQTVVSNTLLLL